MKTTDFKSTLQVTENLLFDSSSEKLSHLLYWELFLSFIVQISTNKKKGRAKSSTLL